jgi:hypothetical protein
MGAVPLANPAANHVLTAREAGRNGGARAGCLHLPRAHHRRRGRATSAGLTVQHARQRVIVKALEAGPSRPAVCPEAAMPPGADGQSASWAHDQFERLPELAAELVRRKVAVIISRHIGRSRNRLHPCALLLWMMNGTGLPGSSSQRPLGSSSRAAFGCGCTAERQCAARLQFTGQYQ